MKSVGLKDDSVSVLVGGEAGQGITRCGSLLGKAFMRGGFNVFGVNDYPSVIRGSHNFYVLRAASDPVFSQAAQVDLLLALNKETVLIHQDELNENGGVIFDERIEFEEGEIRRTDLNLYRVPLLRFVEKIGGPPIIVNTVATGATVALLRFDEEIMKETIRDTFSGREEIIETNIEAMEMGLDYVRETYGESFPCELRSSSKRAEHIMITGNEAIALGAIKAGCKLYSAYPMTPVSPVLHYLAANDTEAGMMVIQPESEIAALNMVIGASFAGLRAMTATSGGGFCLMTEALGLAAMAETPIVLVIGQRPGPSTGMATYTSQGDLLFTIYASQGEYPRIVLAPGDVDECFYLTMEAFNLAEKFQVPSIILCDKYLLESHKSTAAFDEDRVKIDRGLLLEMDEWRAETDYERYKVTENGISPRILIGTKGTTTLSNSNEHVEYGYSTLDREPVLQMAEKRFRKEKYLRIEMKGIEPLRIYGSEKPDVTLIGWGSTKGPALESLRMLQKDGIKAGFCQITCLEPFPDKELNRILKRGGKFLLCEMNRTAQLGKLIKLNNGFTCENLLLKYDGRPFNPEEIYAKAREVLE